MSAWQGTARAPLAAPNTTSLALLTDYMNSVLTVDSARHRLRVQAGMLVTKLMKEAANLNMSLPLGSIPAFADLTLGGVLSTGAHGSGLNTTSSLVRKDFSHSPLHVCACAFRRANIGRHNRHTDLLQAQ
jgi:FAD/FMN-containing dehydrogenase